MGKDVCTPVTMEWIASSSNHGLKSAQGLYIWLSSRAILLFSKKLISADNNIYMKKKKNPVNYIL